MTKFSKRVKTIGASLALGIGVFTIAPAVAAPPSSIAGPQVSEAAVSYWGKSCGPNRGYRTVPQGQGYYTHYEQRERVYWGGFSHCRDTGFRATNRQPIPFGLPYWRK